MDKWLRSKSLWLVVAIVCTIGLISLMVGFSPQDVGPTGVLLWFGLFYFWLISLIVVSVSHIKKISSVSNLQLLNYSLKALVVTAFVALQSLGQLQARDTALFIALILIVTAYLSRLKKA